MAQQRKTYGTLACIGTYPRIGSPKEKEGFKTVGFQVSASQAIDLAIGLLKAAQGATQVDVTCFRHKDRVTVTSTKQR
jgi:hypothetical protein